MEDKQILEIIFNKIKSMKNIDHISLSNRFKEDLGFDSVDMLEFILTMEKEFNVNFSHPFIVLTVQDALTFIKDNKKR